MVGQDEELDLTLMQGTLRVNFSFLQLMAKLPMELKLFRLLVCLSWRHQHMKEAESMKEVQSEDREFSFHLQD